uniref:Uncharacterized protein n=2 Tax=Babesia bovis TaxID=5865 RepID=A7AU98_BABBO|eukprot:XP_001610077.1 hypothetical protein [Babesia bovis T2Bo]
MENQTKCAQSGHRLFIRQYRTCAISRLSDTNDIGDQTEENGKSTFNAPGCLTKERSHSSKYAVELDDSESHNIANHKLLSHSRAGSANCLKQCSSGLYNVKTSRHISHTNRIKDYILLLGFFACLSVVNAHGNGHTEHDKDGFDTLHEPLKFIVCLITIGSSVVAFFGGSTFATNYLADVFGKQDNKAVRAVGCLLVAVSLVTVFAGCHLILASHTGVSKNELSCHVAMQTCVGVLLVAGMANLGLGTVLFAETVKSEHAINPAVVGTNQTVVRALAITLFVISILVLLADGAITGAVIKIHECEGKHISVFGYVMSITAFIDFCIGNFIVGDYECLYKDELRELVGHGIVVVIGQVFGCMIVASVVCSMVVDHVHIRAESAIILAVAMAIKVVVLDHFNFMWAITIITGTLILSFIVIAGLPIGAALLDNGQRDSKEHNHHHHSHGHTRNHSHGSDNDGHGRSSHQGSSSGEEHDHHKEKTVIHIALESCGTIMVAVAVTAWFSYRLLYENLYSVVSKTIHDVVRYINS